MLDSEPLRPLWILVTGWRFWPVECRFVIWRALDAVRGGVLPGVLRVDLATGARLAQPARPDWLERPVVVRHGMSPFGGADLLAEQWAIERGHQVERHPADFAGQGRKAGPERNTRMTELPTHVCLAFPGPESRGTIDCATKAWSAGIETIVNAFADPFDMSRLNRDPIVWPDLPAS